MGAEPPPALPLCPIPLEQAVNCVKGPSGRRYKRPKCSCSAFLLSPSLVLSGITGWGSPTVYPRCKSAHPFPGGSRRQIQAAEVREEKGQSQIPQWGWKSQCQDLRRAFLHHPALPQSCLCLAGEGLLLPGNVKIMLGLVFRYFGKIWVAGKCRKVPSNFFLHVFYVPKAQRSFKCWREAQPTPHTQLGLWSWVWAHQ